MVDNQSSNQNNDSQNQNSDNSNQNTSNNASSYAGGGKKICLGADNGCEQNDCTAIQKGLEDCGNTVTFTCIDPNQEAHMKGKGADFNVFFCNGVGPATMWSFAEAIKAGSLPFTIFGFVNNATYHNQSETDSPLHSMENLRNMAWDPEWDAGQFMDESSTATMKSGGEKTLGEWLDKNSQYIGVCMAGSPEELAQSICSGACGGGGSSSGATEGGSAQIKDKTFEDCIKRICAATDSIFLVENNAAVLFPYTDWMAFTLRQKINQITAKQMDPDLFEIEYNTEGFYNKVTTVWGAEEESDTEVPENETKMENGTETEKKNKDKEKKGNVTTIQKSMPLGGTQLSEQYDPLVKIYGELEKKVTTNFPNEETALYVTNALLIQYIREFNNSCRVRAIIPKKYIGGTFYAVENPNTNESELFYLNSYTMFKTKDDPITTDMEFKYGPEGAEELLDYQAYGGGQAAGGGQTTGSATEEEIWKGTQKACHQWTCGELRTSESDTNDPQVAEDYYNKNVQAGKKFCLTCFGMSAWLYYQFNNKAKIPCRIIGNSDHHVVELYKNNAWYKPVQEYRQYCERGYRYNDYLETASPLVLDAPNPPSGSSTNANASGNTANQNK